MKPKIIEAIAPVELAFFQNNPKTIGQKKVASSPAKAKRFIQTNRLGGFRESKKTMIPKPKEVKNESFFIFSTVAFLFT